MARDFPYVYPYSLHEARRMSETDCWRQSHELNIACKKAIEDAIRNGFDGMTLDAGCAKSVIDDFGYKRTGFVLANTLQKLSYDGRFSADNKAWSNQYFTQKDKALSTEYVVFSHPAVLDGFITEFRQAYQALGLFAPAHCETDAANLDYTGKVLVMSPDTLRESCWSPRNQLWLAEGGFGCSPSSRGRAVYATCLGDGERTRWNREDFTGPIREEFLPDWALEKLAELRTPQQEQTGKARLSEQDISFTEEICEVGTLLNFYMETNFDVDAVFGTNVSTAENDDWLNVYANYDMESGQVCDALEIALHHGDGTDEYMSYTLNAAEKEILLRKMDGYCRQQTGQSLKDYSTQMMAEELAPSEGPVMQ